VAEPGDPVPGAPGGLGPLGPAAAALRDRLASEIADGTRAPGERLRSGWA
jgi:hypothetical protein